jgi:hypothetical protein
VWESCDARTAWMFGKAVMAKPWDGVGTAAMVGTHKAMKPQWVCYKLDKTIEPPCSDFLEHTSEVCKSAHRYNGYLAFQG